MFSIPQLGDYRGEVRYSNLKFDLCGTSLVDQRRFVFKAAPTAVAAAAVSGRPHLASGTDVPRAYTPTFFSAADWAFIVAAVDQLPSGGEGPGGVEPGVSEFIDRQME